MKGVGRIWSCRGPNWPLFPLHPFTNPKVSFLSSLAVTAAPFPLSFASFTWSLSLLRESLRLAVYWLCCSRIRDVVDVVGFAIVAFAICCCLFVCWFGRESSFFFIVAAKKKRNWWWQSHRTQVAFVYIYCDLYILVLILMECVFHFCLQMMMMNEIENKNESKERFGETVLIFIAFYLSIFWSGIGEKMMNVNLRCWVFVFSYEISRSPLLFAIPVYIFTQILMIFQIQILFPNILDLGNYSVWFEYFCDYFGYLFMINFDLWWW